LKVKKTKIAGDDNNSETEISDLKILKLFINKINIPKINKPFHSIDENFLVENILNKSGRAITDQNPIRIP